MSGGVDGARWGPTAGGGSPGRPWLRSPSSVHRSPQDASAGSGGGSWLVSARFDLLAFGAPAAAALLLVVSADLWAPSGETPVGMWIMVVLFIDVGHVWSTVFRTYLNPEVRGRHPCLLIGVPLFAYGLGVAAALGSFGLFWTGLAYVAVFHFVRQQYGWAMLYNRRDPGAGVWDRRIDAAAIYAATGYPLLWWHAHLPRGFAWFMPGDFIDGAVSAGVLPVAFVGYVGALAGFAGRQVYRFVRDGRWQGGKILLVTTTAACWGVGIVVTNTDFAFTVTNVLIHGIPYLAFIYVLERKSARERPPGSLLRHVFLPLGGVAYLVVLFGLAYGEEYLWDRTLWHERPGVFWGPEVSFEGIGLALWMPLLAVPQFTHYILDGLIWRRSYMAASREGRSALD